jgi:hypothetical protein
MSLTNTIIAAVAAAGTVFAFFLAVLIYWESTKREGARQERQQAEQVTAWIEYYESGVFRKILIPIAVNNGSNQPIYQLVVSQVSLPGGFKWRDSGFDAVGDKSFRLFLALVPPGKKSYRMKNRADTGGKDVPLLGIELAFTDAAGQHWCRARDGTLKKLGTPPAEAYQLTDVAWFDAVSNTEVPGV